MREIRPIDHVAATDVPILFIQGTRDKPMPYTEREKLFAAAKNPLSRLELFWGAWHTGAYAHGKERYGRIVWDLVREVEEAALQPAR